MKAVFCFFYTFVDIMKNEIKKEAHVEYKTQYYTVWITRYRRKILVTGVKSYLKIKLQETRKYYLDWKYREIGIKNNHIYLYIVIPSKYAVSKVVETIEKNTSKSLRRKFTFLKKVYSNTRQEQVIGNTCPHCKNYIGNWFVRDEFLGALYQGNKYVVDQFINQDYEQFDEEMI